MSQQRDRPRVRLLVTDLDNTLYDWVDIWHQSFDAMFRKIVEISGLPRDEILDEIREVHQRRGTTEYSYLIQELKCLQRRHQGKDIATVYDPAIHEFRRARKQALQLYPDVAKTLMAIRRSGTRIVAYTESLAYYTIDRIKRLGLDGLIERLYSPKDHDFPVGISPRDLRRFDDDASYSLRVTEHRHTPAGHMKPDPDVLRDIVAQDGEDPRSTVYVGDSIMKDIAMAQSVGVHDVHAKYGVAQHQEEYELLRRVSHWTDEDVERERAIMIRPHVTPSYVLKDSFAELLQLFEFEGAPD